MQASNDYNTELIQRKRTRGCHRSTTNDVSSGGVAIPSAQNVETWGEYVDTSPPVGEVCTTILERGCADSDGLFGTSRRVVACIFIVVTSSDCNMKTAIDGSIDHAIQRGGFAASEGQVGNATLKSGANASANLLVAKSPGLFLRRPGKSLQMPRFDCIEDSLCGPVDARDDIRHRSRTVRAQDFDSNDVGFLGNAIILRCNRPGA